MREDTPRRPMSSGAARRLSLRQRTIGEDAPMPSITPFLWFIKDAEQAVEHYTSIFPNSRITGVHRVSSSTFVSFELDGTPLHALEGGDQGWSFNPSISFVVECADQEEVDHYWSRLTEGGEEGPCGWCTDRFGVSWQVTPRRLLELTTHPDPAVSRPATEAMMTMRKIDIAALEEAVGSRA
jgi:predicted 3-demethylubiquinone-9 3-methyltransferase (glyoxalase superfamily)